MATEMILPAASVSAAPPTAAMAWPRVSLAQASAPVLTGPTGANETDSSRSLCSAALSAYDRMYRALDSDEPDLGGNISYVVGRARLERCSAATPWTVSATDAAQIRALVAPAMATDDARTLSDCFPGFVDRILFELDRRLSRTLAPEGPHRRRRSDRPIS
jgi:hypothetical protein